MSSTLVPRALCLQYNPNECSNDTCALQELRARAEASQLQHKEMLRRAQEIVTEAEDRAASLEGRAEKAEARAQKAEGQLKDASAEIRRVSSEFKVRSSLPAQI